MGFKIFFMNKNQKTKKKLFTYVNRPFNIPRDYLGKYLRHYLVQLASISYRNSAGYRTWNSHKIGTLFYSTPKKDLNCYFELGSWFAQIGLTLWL